MSTTELTTVDKIALYLTARGMEPEKVQMASEGKVYKHSKSFRGYKCRVIYQTKDGGRTLLFTPLKEDNVTEENLREYGFRQLFFRYLKDNRYHTCCRCGGAGGAQQWPGYTCFRCGGNGIDPSFEWEKALTSALAGEDWEGDYIAKQTAKREAQAAQQAEVDRQQRAMHDQQLAAQREAIAILAPRIEANLQFATRNEDAGNQLVWLKRMAQEDNRSIIGLGQFEELATKLERRAKDAATSTSEYLGTVGERTTFTATVDFVHQFRGSFGLQTITTLKDDNGNVLKYGNYIAAKGERVTFTATIKSHEEYRGVKQTVIQRAKLAKEVAA